MEATEQRRLPQIDHLADDALLDIREVGRIVCAGATTLIRKARAGEFPQPLSLATRKLYWRGADIKRFVRERTGGV